MNTTNAQKRLADKEQPYTYLWLLRQTGIGLILFWNVKLSGGGFGQTSQPQSLLCITGIGGWATNKQSAKSKTFALLAGLTLSIMYCNS